MNKSLFPVIFLFLSLNSAADSSIDIDCSKPMGGIEERYCESVATDSKVDAMAREIQTIKMHKLENDAQRAVFDEAQSAWETYMQAQCRFETYSNEFTTGLSTRINECQSELIQRRIIELKGIPIFWD